MFAIILINIIFVQYSKHYEKAKTFITSANRKSIGPAW